MPVVELPDGRKVRFPDDMPREEIKGILASKGLIPEKSAGAPAEKPRQSFFDELANPNPTTQYGMVWPVARDEGGEKEWGRPSELMQSAYRAFTAPTRALTGEMQPEQMQEEAMNLAAYGGSGTLAKTAPAMAREGVRVAQEVAASPAVAELANSALSTARTAAEATGIPRVFERVIDQLPSNVDKAAAKRLVQRLEQDGLSIDEIDSELKRLGEFATIADAGGRNVQGQTRKLIQEPGTTSERADKFLDPRQASQGTRVVESVETNISAKNFYGDLDRLTARQQTKASPLYREAYANNLNVSTPWLRNAMEQDPLIMEGLKRGEAILRREATIEGRKYDPRDYGIVDFNDAGDPILGTETPLSMWHAARRGLDEIIEGYRDTATGKLAGGASQISRLRKALDSELKKATGGSKGAFARADKVFAGPAKIKDAMWMGRNFAKGDEEITAKVFAGLTATEKDAFRSGVAREMIATIRKTGLTPPALKNALRDTAIREKIRLIAPSKKQFEDFVNVLDREARFSQTNALRGGSQTGALAAEGADMGLDFTGTVLAGASGNPMGVATSAVSAALNWLKQPGIPQQVRDRMGEWLLSNDPEVQKQALEMMRQMQTKQPAQLGSNSSPLITGGRK